MSFVRGGPRNDASSAKAMSHLYWYTDAVSHFRHENEFRGLSLFLEQISCLEVCWGDVAVAVTHSKLSQRLWNE